MLLINETFSVDINHSDEWLEWIQINYIPSLKESKLMDRFTLSQVDNSEIQGARSYALQFVVSSKSKMDVWKENLEPNLKQELNRKFAGRYASFQTVLKIISTH